MTNRVLCIPWLGYDGGAVLVQGAIGEPATDSYKVSFLLLTVVAFHLQHGNSVPLPEACNFYLDLLDTQLSAK